MKRFSVCVFLIGVACLGESVMNVTSLLAQDSPHAYFNQLAARPDKLYAYSLRDQAQLNQLSSGSSTSITYSPATDDYPNRQDAAKVVLPGGLVSIPDQVWLPLNVTGPASVLITWDAWWGREYVTEIGSLSSHKAFQISSPITSAELWWEIRTRFTLGPASAVGTIDSRGYMPQTVNADGSYMFFGPRTLTAGHPSSDFRQPMLPSLSTFVIQPETWTRFWALVELRDGPLYDRLSLWMADERVEPVQIYDQLEMTAAQDMLTKFRLEYNSSGDRASTVPLVGYARNYAVLRNVADPTSLFQRPGAGGELPPYVPGPTPTPTPTPTAPSAPRNLRIVPPPPM